MNITTHFFRPHAAAYRSVLAIPLAVVVLHLVAILLPFVNQEPAFNSAAYYFNGGDESHVRAFFAADANTVIVPALGALISKLFGVDPAYGPRLLSIICVGLLALAIPLLAPGRSRTDVMLLQSAILLNPLIWTYSGRGTADFAPVALAVTGIALLWNAPRIKSWDAFAGTLFFTLAAVTKYHAVLLLPFIMIDHRDKPFGLRLSLAIIAAVAVMAALFSYNFVIHQRFGFWFTSPQFMVQLAPTLDHFFNNFVRCCGFLGLLAIPFSAQCALTQRRTHLSIALKLLIVSIAFGAGFLLPPMAGELGFGPFDRWIGDSFSGALLCAAFALFVLSLMETCNDSADYAAAILFFAVIAVLSISRPAQRYLMLLLPFYCLQLWKSVNFRTLAIPAFVVFITLDVFVGLSQFDFIRFVPKTETLAPAKTTQMPPRAFSH